MGGELAQWREWNDAQSLDWHLTEEPAHEGVRRLVCEMNRIYKQEPALWEADHEPAGFEWINAGDADGAVIAYLRRSPQTRRAIVCVCNSGNEARDYRLALPEPGDYKYLLNTDAERFGGGDSTELLLLEAEASPHHGRDYSASLALPPLTTVWLEVPRADNEHVEEYVAAAAGVDEESASANVNVSSPAANSISAPSTQRQRRTARKGGRE
jgi:1,4-alpha-glucan branching enzyme